MHMSLFVNSQILKVDEETDFLTSLTDAYGIDPIKYLFSLVTPGQLQPAL